MSSHHSATAPADGGRCSARRARSASLEGGGFPRSIRSVGATLRPVSGRQRSGQCDEQPNESRNHQLVHNRASAGLTEHRERSVDAPLAERSQRRRHGRVGIGFDDLAHRTDVATRFARRSDDVDDDVDRTGDALVADRRQRPCGCRLQDERFEPEECVERFVGMTRRQRSVVAGVHRLDECQHLVAAHFADDDAIGSQPQRRTDEVGHRDRCGTVEECRPGLESNDVTMLDGQLRRVLHHDESLGAGHCLEQRGDERRLARRCSRRTPRRCTADRSRRAEQPDTVGIGERPEWPDLGGEATDRRGSHHRRPRPGRQGQLGDDRSTRRPSGARTRSIS